jgi:outer membrane protein assembly factor BamB
MAGLVPSCGAESTRAVSTGSSGGAPASDAVPAAAGAPDGAGTGGEDWPSFLGPRHNGVSGETGLLESWPAEGPPLVWERTVGAGYSAPSVLGNRLVVHHRVGRDEVVECLRADTGETLWTRKDRSSFVDPYGYNNGPRCSPVLTEQRCYTFGAEGKLLCLTLDQGELVWSRDVKTEFNVPDGFFGVGATPIIEGDRLIVAAGGQPDSGLVAFDLETGKTLWQSVGKGTWDGCRTDSRLRPVHQWSGDEMVVSYSSPLAATIHGKRHVLALMRHGLVSVDPATGAENFHYWFRSQTHESVNAARPVVVDDTIMLSATYETGSALLRVQADGRTLEEVWRDRRNLQTHWSTSIYHDGYYYGFSGRHAEDGVLRCVAANTGEVVWETDGWGRPPGDLRQVSRDEFIDTTSGERVFYPLYGRGSKIMAEGKFIVLSEFGLLALVRVNSEKWDEISRCRAPRMQYPSWAAPVLARGRLFLRDEDSLVCLDLRRPQQADH